MNCSVILISLTIGDFFKHGSSNWVLCLVNCVSSLFCLEAKPPDWKLWCCNHVLIFYEKFVNLGPWFDLMVVMSRNATVEYVLTYILLYFDLKDKINFRGVGNDMISVCNTFLSKAYSRQHGWSSILVLLGIISVLWQNENDSLSPTYQIEAIKKIVGIGTPSYGLLELLEVDTLNSQSSLIQNSNNFIGVEIVKWYQDALLQTKSLLQLCMHHIWEIHVLHSRLTPACLFSANKDSESGDIHTNYSMLKAMQQATPSVSF